MKNYEQILHTTIASSSFIHSRTDQRTNKIIEKMKKKKDDGRKSEKMMAKSQRDGCLLSIMSYFYLVAN